MIDNNPATLYKKHTITLRKIRDLSEDIYVVQLESRPFTFTPGQYILLGFPGETEKREYSVYSAAADNMLEILIREVKEGDLSRRFRKTERGTPLEVEGPFGFFTLGPDPEQHEKYLFIASGTGISPFHSMVRSYPGIDYTLLHGIRTIGDACEREHYDPSRLITCTSRDDKGDFHGRITAWLQQNPIDPDTGIYLCGNSEMIHDAIDVLVAKGHSLGKMHSEVYF